MKMKIEPAFLSTVPQQAIDPDRLLDYLDKAIDYWRSSEEYWADDYVDAFQSVRKSVFGEVKF
jgi:hypothetical protein